MVFKNGVKNIQAADYNGAPMVVIAMVSRKLKFTVTFFSVTETLPE